MSKHRPESGNGTSTNFDKTGARRAPDQSVNTASQLADVDDDQLMRRILQRDAAALTALFDRHAGKLLNLCRRVTRRDDLADDAVLETYWELWNRADRYDAQRATPLTYLLMLARCRALDLVRREAATHDREQQTARNPAPGPANQEPAQGKSDVRDALDQVSPKCRDALHLCVVNGLTAQQAARSLGVPLGTMKSRVRKGVIQMRALLRTH